MILGPKCLDSWAYIADVTGYGLIVLDTQGGIGTNHGINGRVGRYWKAISNMFYGYPPAGIEMFILFFLLLKFNMPIVAEFDFSNEILLNIQK